MVDHPGNAGIPRTSAPDRVYEAEGIVVEWRAARCIHTANCTQALPEVFDTSARPWIDPGAAAPEEIADAVRRCPTGALRYVGAGLPPDDGGTPVTIAAQPDGPLFVRGLVTLTDHEGGEVTTESRLALCRCGASENKPYCDNSHRKIDWREGS